MSHRIGRLVSVGTQIGPDSGTPATAPGVWEFNFTPDPALGGGNPRFVILHFSSMNFPGGALLEVDVGYGTDTFTSASDADAWTRPIDPQPGPILVRYLGPGPTGGVTLTEYGSGEPTETGTPGTSWGSLTSPDVFLQTDPYTEPTYETRLQCGGVFDWQNAACAAVGSVEEEAAKAVGVIVAAHDGALSSCSGTLIGADLVITAWHCMDDPSEIERRSGSLCFDYQTTCAGAKPIGYAPIFHKIKRIVAHGPSDWAILQIETPPGGLGIQPRSLRGTAAMAGESVTAIHHPHGAVKKMQSGTLAEATVCPVEGFDFAGGSSGSALFDAAGNIIGGALSAGPLQPGTCSPGSDPCSAGYVSSRTILDELANPPSPPTPFDVMLVMDRSGSMGSSGNSGPGITKMDEAKEAASLFVQLVRTNAGDQMGMVSFSTSANRPPDTNMGPVNSGKKTQLVGPSPYVTGSVGALTVGGTTSIGDGLDAAMESLNPPSGNQRAILLMTDGLQNTAPMIEDVEETLGDTRLCVVGFGTEAQLDGPLLTRLARDHNGIYARANDGLELKKFFSLCFGDIFESGALSDPNRVLLREETKAPPVPFNVCEEERITAIVGWDRPTQALELTLRTPGGATLAAGSPGTQSDRGTTWLYLRVPLPHGGEREGTWQWVVTRKSIGGEFPPPPEDVRYFVTVIADGGPRMQPLPPKRPIYTGDPVNPLVALRYTNGTAPLAEVELTVESPDAALGKMVAHAGLTQSVLGGDPLTAFQATLQKLANGPGGLQLPTRTTTVPLVDDSAHGDGAMEPDGIYGTPLTELTRYEGTYTFHARARIRGTCNATREALWSLYVELGIDSGRSTVEITGQSDVGRGRRRAVLRVTPRDRYGSSLGPGRGDRFAIFGQVGSTPAGLVRDNKDGSYSVDVIWDSTISPHPGVVVSQPDRPPVFLTLPRSVEPTWPRWLFVLLAILLFLAIVVILAMALS